MVVRVEDIPVTVPATGLCAVCGFKNGHQWKCINWFMNSASKSYRDRLLKARELLVKLRKNVHVTDAEVADMIDEIDALGSVIAEFSKSE